MSPAIGGKPTRDQQRAARSFEMVSNVTQQEKQEYGSFVMQMPILVRTAGLVGALEFACKHSRILEHLAQHLREAGILHQGEDLRKASREADAVRYMRLTREVLAVLVWHKRFAHSVLKMVPGAERTGGRDGD